MGTFRMLAWEGTPWFKKAVPKRRVKILFSRVTQNCQYYKVLLKRQLERQLNLALKPANRITAHPQVRCFGCTPLWCWPCGHFLLSACLLTAEFEGEDLWAWTREDSLQNLQNFHIFPVGSFHSPRGSHPQDLAHRWFFLPPLPHTP